MCGCVHVGDLVDSTLTAVGSDSHEDMSEAVQQAARRLVSEYWVAHGREAARVEAVARLSLVGAVFFPFSLALFFFACLEFLAVYLLCITSRLGMLKL